MAPIEFNHETFFRCYDCGKRWTVWDIKAEHGYSIVGCPECGSVVFTYIEEDARKVGFTIYFPEEDF